MKPPILLDFPESFQTERLVIRSPFPGDSPEVYAAVRESIGELSPWMNRHRRYRKGHPDLRPDTGAPEPHVVNGEGGSRTALQANLP